MAQMMDTRGARLAASLHRARTDRGWTVAELASRSGVSRAMISRVERAEASPTAMLLGKLSGAYGLTLSQLLVGAEDADRRLARAADQDVWRDPASGYVRRALSPPASGGVELVEVELPPGGDVAFPTDSYTFIRQQMWVLAGTLTFWDGDERVDLQAGDCLALGAPAPGRFVNHGDAPVRYLVVVVR
jgi:transcriptional regulator with XRE-family HTH domain